MLVTNKTIFGRTEKFSEKIQNHGKIKKIFGRTKKFLAEDFFVRKKFTNIQKKGKFSKRRFRNFIRNEDNSMPISRNTNIRVFSQTIVCGPWT